MQHMSTDRGWCSSLGTSRRHTGHGCPRSRAAHVEHITASWMLAHSSRCADSHTSQQMMHSLAASPLSTSFAWGLESWGCMRSHYIKSVLNDVFSLTCVRDLVTLSLREMSERLRLHPYDHLRAALYLHRHLHPLHFFGSMEYSA